MLTLLDIFVSFVYLLLIYLFSAYIVKKYIDQKPYYKYYTAGLFAKILGGILLCIVYTQYYNGGDTTAYFYEGAMPLIKLFGKAPGKYFDILFQGMTPDKYFYFDTDTGWPIYMRDSNSFFIVRIASVVGILGLKLYMPTTIIFSLISYIGVWRLYEVFVNEYPHLHKRFAIAVLFVPSVVFWGSGILKDTVTFAAVGWYTYSFYKLFIKRDFKIRYILTIFIAVYLLISIKPYIIYALLPGSFLWLYTQYLASVKSPIVKVFVMPLLFVIMGGACYLLISQLGETAGKYSVEKLLDQAVVVQQDLKMDYYGGNTFDIGEFEPTASGVLGKMPIATMYGLFSPFIWQAKNPLMLLSALENIFLMYMTILVILRGKNTLRILFTQPLVIFSLVFAWFFAFSVGLTTSNFGSLVRYRIPEIPFWLAAMFMLRYGVREKQKSEVKA